ncbi:DUF1641 domain-containing protein [Jeotgalibacillus sp. S-D1]|nr:DUF1641 domain-containing protein [Jeotgalibacillus sp. S-D1]
MAKATKVIHRLERSEEDIRREELESIENMLLANKEIVKEVFEILQHMKDRGVLDIVSALFARGDKVMDILVKTADTPETANTLKNLLLMLGTLGTINVQQLEPIILKINTGIARVAELEEHEEKGGYFTLLRSLNDPDVKRAMAVGVTFLKGIGEKQDELERTTKTPEEQKHEENERKREGKVREFKGEESTGIPEEDSSKKKRRRNKKAESGGKGWMLAAAGVSLLSIPLSMAVKNKEIVKK